MATKFDNSLSNSIKGKIWLATTALAFFICIFGVLSYLLASFLINDTFYSVFIPFFLVTMTVVGFGWWISNEVVSPVEKASLFAKSLERGLSTSIPKTSGSFETDELIQTLYRISQQTQKLVAAMDDVAKGKLDVSVIPNSNSDRITVTFQKLLGKVSESIHAQQNLEKIEAGIEELNKKISTVYQNNLFISGSSEDERINEISKTFVFLIEQMKETVLQIRVFAPQMQNASTETKLNLESIIERNENRVLLMNQASFTLRKIPQLLQKISAEFAQSAFSANQSIEKAQNGINIAQANLASLTQLRRQIHESIKFTQKLNESSQEIGKIAKTVEDLAHRTNMVALNASIQAADLTEQGRGFAVVSQEVENLAKRANQTNKHISTLNKSIQTEINNVENTLESTISEISHLSRFAIENGKLIEELERYVTQFLTLQEKIIGYTHEQSDDTEKAFQTFADAIPEIENSTKTLKESAQNLDRFKNSVESLNDSVSRFNTAPTTFQSLQQNFSTSEAKNIFEPTEPTEVKNIFEPIAEEENSISNSYLEPDSNNSYQMGSTGEF